MIVETNAPRVAKAVTTVRVCRGEEGTFASWLTQLNETVAASPGYMSAVVMPQVQSSQSDWVMVVLLTLVPIVMLELLYVSPLLQSLNLSVVTFIGNLLSVAALEIVYPATLARFENLAPDAQLGFLSLALSGWMYRLGLAGISVLIAATSVVVISTSVMPRWLALAGFVAALFALLRFLIPLGGILGLVWVLAVSVLLLIGSAGRSARGGPRRLDPSA
jgi:hypothetical protein